MDFEKVKKYLRKEKPYRLTQIERLVYKDFSDDWMDGSSLPLT
jgi:hypothetical protein